MVTWLRSSRAGTHVSATASRSSSASFSYIFRISPAQGIELVVIPSSDNYLRRIKALLFTLVRGFEFELAMPADDIVRVTTGVGHPVIASNPAAGPQLPLLIRPVNMD